MWGCIPSDCQYVSVLLSLRSSTPLPGLAELTDHTARLPISRVSLSFSSTGEILAPPVVLVDTLRVFLVMCAREKGGKHACLCCRPPPSCFLINNPFSPRTKQKNNCFSPRVACHPVESIHGIIDLQQQIRSKRCDKQNALSQRKSLLAGHKLGGSQCSKAIVL